MSTTAIWLIAALVVIAVIFAVLLFLPGQDRNSPVTVAERVSLAPSPGSIVTVRKVGRITSVVIREDIHDHWEGDSIPLPLLPTEVTRREQPELYAEYMDPGTSASRKYEIIDEVYALGYTLPYIRGLNELYKKELKDAMEAGDPDARTALERTPVNLTAASGKDGDGIRRMDIDNGLRHAPLPDMGEGSEGREESQDNQQTE